MHATRCHRLNLYAAGRFFGALAAGLFLLSGCGGGGGGGSTTPPPARTLSTVQVSPATASVAAGSTAQYTATAIYSDATKADVTTQATWSSNAATVASIDSAGKATARTAGAATLTATFQGVAGSTSLSVTAATLSGISVTAAKNSLPTGLSVQLVATGSYSDGTQQNLTSQVTFSSSATGVASIAGPGAGNGLLTAVSAGTSNVTASLGGVTSPAFKVTVTAATLASLTVAAAGNPVSIPKGISLAYTATGTYTDGSTHDVTSSASWLSSNTAVATVNSSGLALGTGVGTSNVSASLGTVTSPSVVLTVTAASLNTISISGASSAPVGVIVPFTATGHYSDGSSVNLTTSVTWSSPNPAITIGNTSGTNGKAVGSTTGSTVISAKDPVSGLSSTSTITLTIVPVALASIAIGPAAPTVRQGQTATLTATGTYNDGSTQDMTSTVTWTSSDTAVATVAAGSVLGVASGTTTVTAASGGVSASVNVGVIRGFVYFAGSAGVYFCGVQADLSLGPCQSATAGSFPGLIAGMATDGTNLFLSSDDGVNAGTILACPINSDGTLSDGNGGSCSLATAANFQAVTTPFQLAFNGVTSPTRAGLYAGGLDSSGNPNKGQPQYCLFQPGINCSSPLGSLAFAPVGTAASTAYLYLSDGAASLYSCALDPTNGSYATCSAIGSGYTSPAGMVFAGGRLYVTETSAKKVLACAENGSGGLASCTTSNLAFQPASITVAGNFAYVGDNVHSVYLCAVDASTGALSGCTFVFGTTYEVLQMAVP